MNPVLTQLSIDNEKWQKAMQSDERIEQIKSVTGKRYWLKKSAPARGVFRYHALNIFSKILRTPILKAVPQLGGSTALKTEIKRIQQLQAEGILVPEICATSSEWILIKDLGVSIIDDMKSNRSNQKRMRKLFTICLKALKKAHLSNQYMSQCFVRNMLMVDEEKKEIGFIDFEDDPLSVMSLEQAQARDLLLFINSTARFFVKDTDYFNNEIQLFLDGHKPEVLDHIKNTNKRLKWVTKLPFQKILGHDYQKLKIGIVAMSKI